MGKKPNSKAEDCAPKMLTKQEIIEDCLDVLEPFIESVIPKEQESQYYDYSDTVEIDLIIEEYFHAA